MARGGNGHDARAEPLVTTANTVASRREISERLLAIHRVTSDRFWQAFAVVALLSLLGVVGVAIRLSDGFGVSDKILWGYYAALFSFILTTAQAAPMVAIAPRIANAHWRRPISRAAELWTAIGLVNLVLFIPLLWVLPSLGDHRRSLWFFGELKGVPVMSPHIWATLALIFLVVTGIALLWVSALPDLALLRDHDKGWRQRWGARLAHGWQGTSRQWKTHYHRLGILGAFYFMMLIFVHFLISVDFLMTLVPGWIDALYPVTHAANALQAGVATVIITMFCLRQFGGYKEYITIDQFWSLGKLLFALSLLWFWFWFSSFNVLWYGKKPNEQAVIHLFMTGPYRSVFIAVFVLNFLVPLVAMIWNPFRRSVWGPPLIAAAVLVGTFLDRVRLYVAAYSIPGIGDPTSDKGELHIDHLPKIHLPDMADIFIVIGVMAACVLVYMLLTRLIPLINIWEQKEMILYRAERKYHRTKVVVLGKPR